MERMQDNLWIPNWPIDQSQASEHFSLLAEVGNKKNTGEQSTISSPHSQPFYIPHPITGPPWDHYRENIQGGTGWGTANDVLHFYQYFSEF